MSVRANASLHISWGTTGDSQGVSGWTTVPTGVATFAETRARRLSTTAISSTGVVESQYHGDRHAIERCGFERVNHPMVDVLELLIDWNASFQSSALLRTKNNIM